MRIRWLLSLCLLVACAKSESAQRDDDAVGEETFRTICAKCHGAAGTGGLPITPGGPKPRDFTDKVWQASRTDAQIEDRCPGSGPAQLCLGGFCA